MFIAVDGIDGAGKTTLVRQLADLLAPLHPLCTKEPTDNSKWGQKLRSAATEGRLPRDKELEYFHLDRIHHLENEIKPALDAGRLVITDRYVDSTLAFQAQTAEEADEMYEKMVGEILVPDITFILRCPVEKGLSRVRSRDGENLTHYENEDVLNRASKIYLSRKGENYVFLDSSGSAKETLDNAVCQLVRKFSEIASSIDPQKFDISVCSIYSDHHQST